ncbi:hypothetical protein ACFU8W_48445 [Streptomyces sp. NPDC057565]|uniref:hypothetical protein n=1 Tax=Streptomyces sp. NPDC057565 TaxID=3346169 RepID=UPI00367F50CB
MPQPDPLSGTLQSIHGELTALSQRITLSKETRGAEPPAREPSLSRPPADPQDPLGPLFDGLESINVELIGTAKRLHLLEDRVFEPPHEEVSRDA